MKTALRTMLLLATASSALSPAFGQDQASSANTQVDEEEIVVAGQRPRGSVIGDAEPEVTFNGGDVRALGVGSISELLTELSSQLTSTRGGDPVVLLEGRRISSFREIASIPAEAIQRAEILSEEVALRYGYSANQKVLNIVLRQRFRAVTVDGRDKITTQWDANSLSLDTGFLTIRRDHRLNLNVKYEQADLLEESQRGITAANSSATGRSLRAGGETLTIGATYARTFSPKVSSSINGELVTDRSDSLVGRSSSGDAFTRTADDLSLRLGGTVNAQLGKWYANLTGGYNRTEGRTITVRGTPAELAQSWTDTANADLLVNGTLFRLPAGKVSLTTHVGGTLDGYRAQIRSTSVTPGADLDRGTGLISANIDVPLFKSGTPVVGRLSVNGNVEQRELSDFGSLTNWGGGMTWTPFTPVTFTANYSAEETAPSMVQLGGPQIVTPLVPIFDFTTGQSVLVTRTSGGNPALRKAQSDNWRLGLSVKPFTAQDLTLQVSYAHSDTRNGVGSISGLTAETFDAFPDRFMRDDNGTLISVDATPINIASQRSSELRWGFNFSKRLSLPQAELDAMRAMFEKMRAEREARRAAAGATGQRGNSGDGPPPGEGGPPPGEDGPPAGERRMGGGFSGGGPRGPGGPGGGGGPGGRLTVAVFHTIKLQDTVQLHSSLPSIDLLDGGSLGGGSGTPRHQVELQMGASRSGVGLRFTGKWQSATRVVDTSGTSTSELRFGDLATFSLRAFVNPSQLPGQMGKNGWLRGARISLSVDNILNTRQTVRDETGATPFAYLPAYRDPLGRTLSISLRKQFF